MSCYARGVLISRQARIQDKTLSACSGALLSSIYKQKTLLIDNKSRPGHIFLAVWNAGQTAASNVAVSSPLQSGLIINASETINFAL